MSFSFPLMGEFFALATAITWALAVILFTKSGETVHPLALTLFNCILGFGFVHILLTVTGMAIWPAVSSRDAWLLIISGALGIAISDWLFFQSLNMIGAGFSAIIDCLYSPFIIFMSVFWLKERLGLVQICGVALIVLAVGTATHARGPRAAHSKQMMVGVIIGIAAIAFLAVSIVMAKMLLTRIPFLQVAQIRLFGGLIVMLPMIMFHPRRHRVLSSLLIKRGWIYTLSGSLIGTCLAMLMWLAGMKYTQASIAAALNQTSNLFIFVFAAWLLKEPIDQRKTIAIVLGAVGSFMVTFG